MPEQMEGRMHKNNGKKEPTSNGKVKQISEMRMWNVAKKRQKKFDEHFLILVVCESCLLGPIKIESQIENAAPARIRVHSCCSFFLVSRARTASHQAKLSQVMLSKAKQSKANARSMYMHSRIR